MAGLLVPHARGALTTDSTRRTLPELSGATRCVSTQPPLTTHRPARGRSWLRIQISQIAESPQRANLGSKPMQEMTRRAALQGTAAVAAVAAVPAIAATDDDSAIVAAADAYWMERSRL